MEHDRVVRENKENVELSIQIVELKEQLEEKDAELKRRGDKIEVLEQKLEEQRKDTEMSGEYDKQNYVGHFLIM